MARIIIYVSGGNVQDIISDTTGDEVMLVDYDNEEGTTNPERAFRKTRVDQSLFNCTVAGKEQEGSEIGMPVR